MNGSRTRFLSWLLPFILFLLYIPFSSTLDLAVANHFVQSDGRFHAPAWCLFMYTYGLLPGQIFFVGSVVVFIASFVAPRFIRLRRPALYIALTLIIGSGIFGHAVFKQFWNRPRPKQVALFGGKYPFCPLTKPYKGPSDRFLRSLPSGHATMGFYFLSLYFIGKRLGRRWIARGGLCITAGLGTLVAWARLAQGGHFLSDIVVSMLIMWMTAYWLDYFILRGERLWLLLPQNNTESSMPYNGSPKLTAMLPRTAS
jgi:lipid A 4'-phosphatase